MARFGFQIPATEFLFDYEGRRAESEIGRCNLYRIDPETGTTNVVADDFERPNGQAFSPDESNFHAADACVTRKTGGPKHIRRQTVNGNSVN